MILCQLHSNHLKGDKADKLGKIEQNDYKLAHWFCLHRQRKVSAWLWCMCAWVRHYL